MLVTPQVLESLDSGNRKDISRSHHAIPSTKHVSFYAVFLRDMRQDSDKDGWS